MATVDVHAPSRAGQPGAPAESAHEPPVAKVDPGRLLVGAALLVAAATIWGFAFIPQKKTVEVLTPLAATAVRFVLAAPLALAVSVLVRSRRRVAPPVGTNHAVLLGVMLFFAYVLQTAALVYAPVARVSLITGLYAVFVPFFARLLGHARPTRAHWGGAVVAFLGLLGLVGVVGDADALSVPLNVGDVLVLGHALISAFQVLIVARLSPGTDPFVLNAGQLSTVMVLSMVAALAIDGPAALLAATTLDVWTWAAFGYLAAFSTVLAFLCQIVGQRYTSAPTAAVIMLLESPLAVVAAVIFLGERMGPLQWLGALTLVVGVLISLGPDLIRANRARASAAPAGPGAPPPRS